MTPGEYDRDSEDYPLWQEIADREADATLAEIAQSEAADEAYESWRGVA